MSDFVAYHNTEKMGREFKPTRRFHFFSRKPEVFLRKALGNRVWTITGSRADSGRMLYRLAGVFTASDIRPELDGFSISGDGTPFRPPIDVTAQSWFSELLREQNKFSFGFSRIRDENIVKGLESLGDQQATPADSGIALSEGSQSSVSVTVYERNPVARQECIHHYGTSCFVCGFSFEETYGERLAGYIHVHHLESVAARDGEYIVNPISDLRPVCPNCHAVIHSTNPSLSIEDLKRLLRTSE